MAKVADGNVTSARSTAGQTFEIRQDINHNRQVVGGYRDSGVVQQYKKEAYEDLRRKKALEKLAQQSGAPTAEHAREELHKTVESGNYPSRLKRQRKAKVDVILQRPSAGLNTSDARGSLRVDSRPSSVQQHPTATRTTFRDNPSRRYNPYA